MSLAGPSEFLGNEIWRTEFRDSYGGLQSIVVGCYILPESSNRHLMREDVNFWGNIIWNIYMENGWRILCVKKIRIGDFETVRRERKTFWGAGQWKFRGGPIRDWRNRYSEGDTYVVVGNVAWGDINVSDIFAVWYDQSGATYRSFRKQISAAGGVLNLLCFNFSIQNAQPPPFAVRPSWTLITTAATRLRVTPCASCLVTFVALSAASLCCACPLWHCPTDDRIFTNNLLRHVPTIPVSVPVPVHSVEESADSTPASPPPPTHLAQAASSAGDTTASSTASTPAFILGHPCVHIRPAPASVTALVLCTTTQQPIAGTDRSTATATPGIDARPFAHVPGAIAMFPPAYQFSCARTGRLRDGTEKAMSQTRCAALAASQTEEPR